MPRGPPARYATQTTTPIAPTTTRALAGGAGLEENGSLVKKVLSSILYEAAGIDHRHRGGRGARARAERGVPDLGAGGLRFRSGDLRLDGQAPCRRPRLPDVHLR